VRCANSPTAKLAGYKQVTGAVRRRVSDAAGDPLLVVMAEPAASLAAELRRLIPELRDMVGDDRRVLVGFDRGGWSPTLFTTWTRPGSTS
jgi:hypothetical protein